MQRPGRGWRLLRRIEGGIPVRHGKLRRVLRWVPAVSLCIVLGWAAGTRADDWTAPRAITSVDFDDEILASMGVRIEAVGGMPGSYPEFPGDSFMTRAPSLLAFSAPGGDFERFSSGSLFHAGGFLLQLSGGGQAVSLDDFVLRVAAQPDDFDWIDATGRRFFILRHMQFTTSLAEEELRLLNVSIHLAPELAATLGRPDLTDTYVGVANIRLPALLSTASDPGGSGASAACQVQEGEIDVSLVDLASPSQIAREAGVRVAIAFSATLTNTGTGSVDWYEPIAPTRFDGVGPHPFLSLAMYRLDDDGLVQLGLGDVKHAFRALNIGCPCPSASSLYPGCGDVYGVSTNQDRSYLAPREEVTSYTGAWERVGSHFDRCLAREEPPCDPASNDEDDFRDHYGEGDFYHDAFEHRLVVPESGLLEEDGRFFLEAWYVAAGDVDLWNSLGHREVEPALSGSTWSFELDGSLESGSMLDHIPGADRVLVDTGAGRLQLASVTTDLDGGVHRYAYTLMNFDFDRSIAAFRVPLEPGTQVTRIRSRALGDDPARDWAVVVEESAITWQAPPGEALDWGMLVGFGFDADRDPVPSSVRLAVLEPGSPTALVVSAMAPAPEPATGMLATSALAAVALVRRYGHASRGGRRP